MVASCERALIDDNVTSNTVYKTGSIILETVNETGNNLNETVLCDIKIEPKNIIDCNIKETDSIIKEIVDKCPNETIEQVTSVNKSNLSPATIEESWSKYLFWPKPDTKKKPNRSQVKLPYFPVTPIKWREYHACSYDLVELDRKLVLFVVNNHHI